jgi:hypothetical protein
MASPTPSPQKRVYLGLYPVAADAGQAVPERSGGWELVYNFVQSETILTDVASGKLNLTAHTADAAGNIEKRPHLWTVMVPR